MDEVTSPFDEYAKGVISDDRRAAIVTIKLDPGRRRHRPGHLPGLETETDRLQDSIPGSVTSIGGEAYNDNRPGLSLVEGVGVLVALVVLFLTLGSLRAAGMPLLTALLGVGLTMVLIFGATGITTVSSTTPLLALMLGLAVGIDYALFIVSRHREQLRERHGAAGVDRPRGRHRRLRRRLRRSDRDDRPRADWPSPGSRS